MNGFSSHTLWGKGSDAIPHTRRPSSLSKLRYEANEIFTVARTEVRQHGPANFNLACAYFRPRADARLP